MLRERVAKRAERSTWVRRGGVLGRCVIVSSGSVSSTCWMLVGDVGAVFSYPMVMRRERWT